MSHNYILGSSPGEKLTDAMIDNGPLNLLYWVNDTSPCQPSSCSNYLLGNKVVHNSLKLSKYFSIVFSALIQIV